MVCYERIALFFEPNSHFLDHLGVFCSLFQIPAFFSDPSLEKVAKKYYPDLQTSLISPAMINSTTLHKLANIIYIPLYRYSQDFATLSSLGFLEKKPRFIYIPHGFSDKITDKDILDHAHLEEFFVYGEYERNLFNKALLKPSSIFLGNYRHHFFQERKEFYHRIIKQEILHKSPSDKIILYAPTWQDPRVATDFFATVEKLIHALPKEVHLIIKPHPLLYRYHLADMLQLEQKITHHSSVLLLDDYPLIFPILEHVDVLLTDYSSIGYDFLPFNKPLFFLLSDKTKTTRLHECGCVIDPKYIETIFPLPTNNLQFTKAQQLYAKTFHQWESLEQFEKQMKTGHFIHS